MITDLEILLIGNPVLNLLSYIFVVLLIFNLLKVNYFNPIVAVFLKIYKPISKIFFLSPNQIINIIIISLLIKFISLFILFGGQEKNLLLFGLAVIQILIAILRIIFYAVIGGVIISWVSPNSSNPFVQLIEEISHKALSPIRKYIPSAGGLDFSPLFILILINVLVVFLMNFFRLL
ncbi:MAG: YggT family protein [Gammaproteobacteria bacterium]|tara:strand:- start:7196 stop:7726 length:531 start_codon:yes stop_codon:yes gene_type:complete